MEGLINDSNKVFSQGRRNEFAKHLDLPWSDALSQETLQSWILEDSPFGDLTSDISISSKQNAKGKLIAKQSGVIAGSEIICSIFSQFNLKFTLHRKSTEIVEEGSPIITVEGNARKILLLERLCLNLLSHLSGIASYTYKAKKIVGDNIQIASTRKTTPGLRKLEKFAVLSGGGSSHRFSLSDLILLKDNHIKLLGDVSTAISHAKKFADFSKKIEVEVKSEEEALSAITAGADIVMLDNFEAKELPQIVEKLRKKIDGKTLIEISGGVTLENLEDFSKCKPDIISMGSLTHSAQSLDLSLKLHPV